MTSSTSTSTSTSTATPTLTSASAVTGTVWTLDPSVVWLDQGEEISLYRSDVGEFETLNRSASAIWRLLVAGTTPADIAVQLAETFGAADDAQRRQVAGDVERFVAALAEQGLIRS